MASITVSPETFLNAPIEAFRSELKSVVTEVREMTALLDENHLNWQPEPKRWSVAQCLDHLNKAAVRYVDALPEVIRNAHADGRTGSSKPSHGLLGGIFLRLTEPPPKLRVLAPKPFVPSSRLEREALLGEYEDLRAKIDQHIIDANGLDLSRVRLPFPPAPQLKFRLGTVFAIFLSHERRHVWQARNVIKELRAG